MASAAASSKRSWRTYEHATLSAGARNSGSAASAARYLVRASSQRPWRYSTFPSAFSVVAAAIGGRNGSTRPAAPSTARSGKQAPAAAAVTAAAAAAAAAAAITDRPTRGAGPADRPLRRRRARAARPAPARRSGTGTRPADRAPAPTPATPAPAGAPPDRARGA